MFKMLWADSLITLFTNFPSNSLTYMEFSLIFQLKKRSSFEEQELVLKKQKNQKPCSLSQKKNLEKSDKHYIYVCIIKYKILIENVLGATFSRYLRYLRQICGVTSGI